MESIYFEPTFKTPLVELDKEKGSFLISGRSLPENAEEFYGKIKFWMEKYFDSPNENTLFEFKMNYYNTASSKMILELFKLLKSAYDGGIKIEVVWGHDKNDEEVKEDGNDFADIVGIPITIRPIEG